MLKNNKRILISYAISMLVYIVFYLILHFNKFFGMKEGTISIIMIASFLIIRNVVRYFVEIKPLTKNK
ncbi:MAG: hypothetical protein GX038_01860 [Erysipelothrix sp.]|nr:hypothetical protein [Erysipelothrix sp.]